MNITTTGDEYRFVHLSDPHLSIPRVDSYRQLMNKRLLGYLSWLHKRRIKHQQHVLSSLFEGLSNSDFDQLIVTGDLTHLGLPVEFEQVLEWMQSTGGPEKITIVPGNHDALATTEWRQNFALWNEYLASDTPDNPQAQPFPSLRVRGPVAFIGLSSALPTLPLLATGTVDPLQLALLPELLDQCAKRGLFRVILVHHAPFSRFRYWRKRLTNAHQLREIISTHGAEMILHGHTHRSSLDWLQVNDRAEPVQIPVIATSSASATSNDMSSRASYNHYHLQVREDLWQVRMRTGIYQPEIRQFVTGEASPILIPFAR